MSSQWVVPIVCIHGFYIAVLIGVTMAVRHIEFKFHEFKDLLRGIIVSSIAVGMPNALGLLIFYAQCICLTSKIITLIFVLQSCNALAQFSISYTDQYDSLRF